ncbi:hypothetical protein DFH09DRAFT_1112420 [Mycena vulgaris]|nr:hypothetical protein DFH09DRAFT_1112420 [Mycena vulgaris]
MAQRQFCLPFLSLASTIPTRTSTGLQRSDRFVSCVTGIRMTWDAFVIPQDWLHAQLKVPQLGSAYSADSDAVNALKLPTTTPTTQRRVPERERRSRGIMAQRRKQTVVTHVVTHYNNRWSGLGAAQWTKILPGFVVYSWRTGGIFPRRQNPPIHVEAKHTQTTRFFVLLAVPTLERLLYLGQWAPRVRKRPRPSDKENTGNARGVKRKAVELGSASGSNIGGRPKRRADAPDRLNL